MRYVSTLDQSYNPYLRLTYILDLYFDNVCSCVDNCICPPHAELCVATYVCVMLRHDVSSSDVLNGTQLEFYTRTPDLLRARAECANNARCVG